MVNKSYVVNNPRASGTRIASEHENNNGLVKCEKGEKMQNNEQKKIFDRYILQISNEMVSAASSSWIIVFSVEYRSLERERCGEATKKNL